MNSINRGNKELNIIEGNYLKGTENNHTHIRFYLKGFKRIVSKGMFEEYFPDQAKEGKNNAYLIKIKITE